LKTHLEIPLPAVAVGSTSPSLELSEEEEQIVRYAAGYVPMFLLKKYERGSTNKSIEYVECLSKMAVNGEESSFLSYTLEWSKILNHGGLFKMNDEAYRLFRHIE